MPSQPRQVALLEALVNSLDVESGADRLETSGDLATWLSECELPGPARPSAADAARLRELREALRAVLLMNNGGPDAPDAIATLNSAGEHSRLRVAFSGDGAARLEPAASAIDATIGAVLAAVERMQAEGHWSRRKACAAHTCQWAYFDESRNRSRTWCDMAVCGNRAKARAFRARTTPT
jgi:predicted RNA-binding Zn ribbon-like protein